MPKERKAVKALQPKLSTSAPAEQIRERILDWCLEQNLSLNEAAEQLEKIAEAVFGTTVCTATNRARTSIKKLLQPDDPRALIRQRYRDSIKEMLIGLRLEIDEVHGKLDRILQLLERK